VPHHALMTFGRLAIEPKMFALVGSAMCAARLSSGPARVTSACTAKPTTAITEQKERQAVSVGCWQAWRAQARTGEAAVLNLLQLHLLLGGALGHAQRVERERVHQPRCASGEEALEALRLQEAQRDRQDGQLRDGRDGVLRRASLVPHGLHAQQRRAQNASDGGHRPSAGGA